MHKTKIVATLGPSTNNIETMCALIKAGLSVARINLSHGNRKSHAEAIAMVKEARKKVGIPTAILLDNRGPEIRVGELETPLHLKAEEELVITTDEKSVGVGRITTNYSGIINDVEEGQRILLDDGKITLIINRISGSDIFCTVKNSGTLSSRKRVALPESIVNLPALSSADIADIAFGVEQEVDFIAASFIRKAEDVWNVRKVIEQYGGSLAIISKIENQQGVDNLQEILDASDGMMVARGDLGVELPAERVPVIQKKIIRLANLAGKPVITATQMLESMITSPTPTRAEASDVTNAIFDGTDAVMLSAETAVGKYPLEAVNFLARCAKSAEAALDYETLLRQGRQHRRATITDSISYACCATAKDLQAAAIITSTTSGSTARMVSRYRPATPIIAVSTSKAKIRQLQLVRGVTTVLLKERASTMDEQLDLCVRKSQEKGLIRNGDLVIITAGMPIGTTGTTNLLKVKSIADICFQGKGVSPGKIEGPVRIIRQAEDWENLPQHAIVVMKKHDDQAMKMLTNANGIIIEEAVSLSHTVSVAKEMNIPVVCDVEDATSKLENGQMLTIDGTSGQICYGRASL